MSVFCENNVFCVKLEQILQQRCGHISDISQANKKEIFCPDSMDSFWNDLKLK